jgi:hypothetical protein
VGVEPTIQPAKGRIAGFEGREGHRTLFASAGIIEAIRGPFNFWGRKPIKVQKMAMSETLTHTFVTCRRYTRKAPRMKKASGVARACRGAPIAKGFWGAA